MGHSQFERIPMSKGAAGAASCRSRFEEITEDGIAELKASRAERFTIKELERTKKKLTGQACKSSTAAGPQGRCCHLRTAGSRQALCGRSAFSFKNAVPLHQNAKCGGAFHHGRPKVRRYAHEMPLSWMRSPTGNRGVSLRHGYARIEFHDRNVSP